MAAARIAFFRTDGFDLLFRRIASTRRDVRSTRRRCTGVAPGRSVYRRSAGRARRAVAGAASAGRVRRRPFAFVNEPASDEPHERVPPEDHLRPYGRLP